MTDHERQAATLLAGCWFLPGSYEKRFAQDMAAIAGETPEKELSSKQRRYLWKLVYRYRRQLPQNLMFLAIEKKREMMQEEEWLTTDRIWDLLEHLGVHNPASLRSHRERKFLFFKQGIIDREKYRSDVPWTINEAIRNSLRYQSERCCHILRDIFGNPFKPVLLALSDGDNPVDTSGNATLIPRRVVTPQVKEIAETIYRRNQWEDCGILADCLEENGCQSEELLGHLRNQQEHWRGCWCVDLLTGRE